MFPYAWQASPRITDKYIRVHAPLDMLDKDRKAAPTQQVNLHTRTHDRPIASSSYIFDDVTRACCGEQGRAGQVKDLEISSETALLSINPAWELISRWRGTRGPRFGENGSREYLLRLTWSREGINPLGSCQ